MVATLHVAVTPSDAGGDSHRIGESWQFDGRIDQIDRASGDSNQSAAVVWIRLANNQPVRVVVPTIAVCADHGTPHLCVQGECELIVKGTGANHGRRVCWATGRDHGVFHGDRSAPGTIAMRGAMRTVTYECVPELAESGGTVSVQVPEFAPALCDPQFVYGHVLNRHGSNVPVSVLFVERLPGSDLQNNGMILAKMEFNGSILKMVSRIRVRGMANGT